MHRCQYTCAHTLSLQRAPALTAKGSQSSTSSKTRSHASTSKPKPSLLGMKPVSAPARGKAKRAAQKARDADVRAELDGGNLSGLRQALKSADKVCGP